MAKTRLDQLVLQNGLASDIKQARAMILAGEVLADDCVADKVGQLVDNHAQLRLRPRARFVSRGGSKLAAGLNHFGIKVDGVCIDIGASTGGFTDCLLQHGATKVYAVDVGYGQLAWKIRQDPRVVVLERFNARKINRSHIQNDSLRLAVIDASFISLTKLLGPVSSLFVDTVSVIALIKPQFELPREDIGDGGVVTDDSLHQKAIEKIVDFSHQLHLHVKGVTPSPLLGPKGNREFLIHIVSG